MSRPFANSRSCLKRTAQSLLMVKTSKKSKVASQPCFKDRFIPRHRIQWGLPMERPLPQIAGAWRPLGDGRNNIVSYWDRFYCIVLGGHLLPLGLPLSGEPGPPLGNSRPGRRPKKHAICHAIQAALLSGKCSLFMLPCISVTIDLGSRATRLGRGCLSFCGHPTRGHCCKTRCSLTCGRTASEVR